jgi:hypothetical protein
MNASCENVEVRAVCPECGYVATLTELLCVVVDPRLANCPKCEIGSPPREWKAPAVERPAAEPPVRLTGRMPVICQYCGDKYKEMLCEPAQDGKPSHGTCEPCFPRLFAQIGMTDAADQERFRRENREAEERLAARTIFFAQPTREISASEPPEKQSTP